MLDFSDVAHGALPGLGYRTRASARSFRIVVAHVYDLRVIGFPDAALMVDATTAAHLSDDAQKGLDRELVRVRDRGVSIEGQLKQGDAREVLPSLAGSLGAALIVVGSHGRRGLARALLGSVAEAIVRASTVPVTVVRQPA